MAVGLVWIFFSRSTLAFWTLNTADIQSNPLWAGDKLVWNDNRLGYEAIFVRLGDGAVQPLLAAPSALVAASDKYVQFISDGKTYYLCLTSNTIFTSVPDFVKNDLSYRLLSNGGAEIVSTQINDIVITMVDPPAFTIYSEFSANQSHFFGSSNAASVTLSAKSDSNLYNQTALVLDQGWDIAQLIPINAPDGEYIISGIATSSIDVSGSPQVVGKIIIDHTPPAIDQLNVEIQVDQIKLHWHTDEKTTTQIVLTPMQSDLKAITKNYKSLTKSHTNTISSLVPSVRYSGVIIATDVVGITSEYHFKIVMPSLHSIKPNDYAELAPREKGIWRGYLLAEPGVIAEDKALIMLDKPYILDWTVGRPPPGMVRGSNVVIYGTVNSKGNSILMHGAYSIEVLNGSANVDSAWIGVSGVLTSVAKSGWKIKLVDGTIVEAEWLNYPSNLPKIKDKIAIFGLRYQKSSGDWVIAATDWQMIEPAVVKTTTVYASVVNSTSVIAPTEFITATTYQQTDTQSSDKSDQTWYYLGLIVTEVVIYKIFFLSKTK